MNNELIVKAAMFDVYADLAIARAVIASLQKEAAEKDKRIAELEQPHPVLTGNGGVGIAEKLYEPAA